MPQQEIILRPEEAFDEEHLVEHIRATLKLSASETVRPVRRSIDARGKLVKVRLLVEWGLEEDRPPYQTAYRNVAHGERVVIVGAGPAGLFAAIRLIELGMKPIILERGKDVQSRRRDIAAINKEQIVNEDSNYCFGEGGAGTYSDGKLYTRSTKRGDVSRILEILIAHGAPETIRFDAHPHIGTNKLPKIVAALRDSIRAAGGEVHFGQRVSGFIRNGDEMKGVITADGVKHEGSAVILATGHSARDIYELLAQSNIHIEAKPFALGVRVEHPQSLIDKIQYHCATDRGPHLPASSYSLVHQARINGADRGVFSFCMCPGGFIVPAATAPGEIVVNGMSPSRRDSFYANSGIVVAIQESDFSAYANKGPLAGLSFQQAIERKACQATGGGQVAPAQRLMDFLDGKQSASLPSTSYQPGLASVDLIAVLPDFIVDALRQGFRNFGSRMRGYLTNEAQVIGVESRTSSPVRIPRHPETLEHVHVARLFPCAEGAGYAGGIVSAAMDGERCAESLAKRYSKMQV